MLYANLDRSTFITKRAEIIKDIQRKNLALCKSLVCLASDPPQADSLCPLDPDFYVSIKHAISVEVKWIEQIHLQLIFTLLLVRIESACQNAQMG